MKNTFERNIDFFNIFCQLHNRMYATKLVSTQNKDFFFLASQERIWGVPINITFPMLQEIIPQFKKQIIVLGEDVAPLSESLQFVWCNNAGKLQDKELQGFYCFNEEAYIKRRQKHFQEHQVGHEKTDYNLLRWNEQSLIFLLTTGVLRGEISAKNDFNNLLRIDDYKTCLANVWQSPIRPDVLKKEVADREAEIYSLSAVEADKYIAGLMAQLLFMTNNTRKESTDVLMDRIVSAIKDNV